MMDLLVLLDDPKCVCYVLCPGNTHPNTGGVFRFKKTSVSMDGSFGRWKM